MSKRSFIMAVTALATVLALGSSGLASADSPKVLEFKTMVGVPQAFTNPQNPIRGINGGGIPWTLTAAKGELAGTGRLRIHVTGLVLAAGPNTGRNPSATFRGLVSCLASDGSVVNVSTDPFPATVGFAADGGGNAEIDQTLTLPSPCIAPIVFVTSAGGSWFAATGF